MLSKMCHVYLKVFLLKTCTGKMKPNSPTLTIFNNYRKKCDQYFFLIVRSVCHHNIMAQNDFFHRKFFYPMGTFRIVLRYKIKISLFYKIHFYDPTITSVYTYGFLYSIIHISGPYNQGVTAETKQKGFSLINTFLICFLIPITTGVDDGQLGNTCFWLSRPLFILEEFCIYNNRGSTLSIQTNIM